MKLILGTAQLARDYGDFEISSQRVFRQDAEELLNFALSRGITVLDTAPSYGLAERWIGELVSNFEVHTKVNDSRRMFESLRGSIRALRPNEVSVCYFHDSLTMNRWQQEFAEILEALASEAISLGASLYEIEEVDLVLRTPAIRVVQIPLSVIDRRFDDQIRAKLRESGKTVVVRSIFHRGWLTRTDLKWHGPKPRFREFLRELDALSRQIGVETGHLAMQWIKNLPDIDKVIVGARTRTQLEKSLAWWDQPIGASLDSAVSVLPEPPWSQLDLRISSP
jgi:aryl-alcohol dehydrogenase-like predicted oxidoreductase